MFSRITVSLGVLVMLIATSCDRVPLLAPTNSSVTIDAQSRVVSIGGTTTVTATVLESSGTPVQNGTQVRFTTSLGRMDPVEAQTRNGVATSTFMAGDDSGIAEVRATSGGSGGSTTTTPGNTTTTPGTTTPSTPTTNSSNVVQIAVGAGAVDTVTVSANPSSVSTTGGGTVTVTATALGTGGRLLSGIPVNFSVNRGTLSATTAPTNTQGQAQVTLATNGETTITVAAGTKTATATVTGRPGPSVVLTCTVAGANNCAAVAAGQPAVFTAARESGSATLTSATLDFGDNSSQSLGTLSSSTTIPHSYAQAGTYTARLTGTDANGETSTSIQVIQVNAVTITVSASISSGTTVTATAIVNAPVSSYLWNWGDGQSSSTTSASTTHGYASGTYTITVTATLQSGGTVTGNTSIVVP